VVEEEADESALWLELTMEGGLLRRELVEPLWIEANELVAIMTSSRKSAAKSLVTASRVRVRNTPIANQKSKI
jgi:hypothetical protein